MLALLFELKPELMLKLMLDLTSPNQKREPSCMYIQYCTRFKYKQALVH